MHVTYTEWDHHGNTKRTQLFKMRNFERPEGPWPATAPCGDTKDKAALILVSLLACVSPCRQFSATRNSCNIVFDSVAFINIEITKHDTFLSHTILFLIN